MNFWQGKKTRLRGVEPSDAETFYQWNLDSEMARNLHAVWPPPSRARVKSRAEAAALQPMEHDMFTWMIEDSPTGTPVGVIETHTCEPHNGTFSYAIRIAREHQRKGHASEAILLVLKYYFEELRYQKAWVTVYSHNPSSAALHEKLGFTREGALQRMVYTTGKYFDLYYYGMTKEEWERSSSRR